MGAAETWDVIPVDDYLQGELGPPIKDDYVNEQVFTTSGGHSVTVWRRGESGFLAEPCSKPDSLIPPPEIGASPALADLHEGVAMSPEPEEDRTPPFPP